MIVRLTKLSDNPNGIIDGIGVKKGVIGFINNEPKVGEGMNIYLNYDRMDSTYMYTTKAKSVEHFENKYIVHTQNSKYQVDVLPDDYYTSSD